MHSVIRSVLLKKKKKRKKESFSSKNGLSPPDRRHGRFPHSAIPDGELLPLKREAFLSHSHVLSP